MASGLQRPDEKFREVFENRSPAAPGTRSLGRHLVNGPDNCLTHDRRVILRCYQAVARSRLNGFGPVFAPALQKGLGLRPFGVNHSFVRHRRIQHTGMTLRIIENRQKRVGDEFFQRVIQRNARADIGIEFAARIVHEIQKTGPLVGKMQIEGTVADIGLAGDILRPGGVVAALDEQLARGGFDFSEAVRLFAARPCLVQGLDC